MGQTESKQAWNVYDAGYIIDDKCKYLKQVDVTTEYIIFGYSRPIQQIFIKLYKITIPVSILSVCASYYYNPEYFHGINDKSIKVSNDTMSISKISERVWDNTSFGFRSISSINKNPCI